MDEQNGEWEILDENFNVIKKVQSFAELIPLNSIPFGIEFNSYVEVFESCFRILYL